MNDTTIQPNETMQRMVNRDILRFAVSRAIQCPVCRQILDMRQAVLVTIEPSKGTYIQCAPCYDTLKPRYERTCTNNRFTMDVLDGRQLWRRK